VGAYLSLLKLVVDHPKLNPALAGAERRMARLKGVEPVIFRPLSTAFDFTTYRLMRLLKRAEYISLASHRDASEIVGEIVPIRLYIIYLLILVQPSIITPRNRN
jgi:hypothetical protein